jgi:hypothetical protein
MGRKQTVVVRGLADRHMPKADARELYDDRTPKPTEEEIQLRRLTRLARALAPAPVTPDKRERRRLRRVKEGENS